MDKYRDTRQSLWKETFQKALAYTPYLDASDPAHARKWRDMEPRMSVADPAATLLKGFTRRLNVLCYSGVWCGDCVRQGPIFQKFAELAPSIDLRFAERVDGSPLAEELRINGAYKVPVVVFLSEDFFELGRFGDRLLTVYRSMARRQLGAACATGLVAPPPDELQAEIGEWADVFERMHLILRLSPMLRERYQD
jgi:hypothetical protein